MRLFQSRMPRRCKSAYATAVVAINLHRCFLAIKATSALTTRMSRERSLIGWFTKGACAIVRINDYVLFDEVVNWSALQNAQREGQHVCRRRAYHHECRQKVAPRLTEADQAERAQRQTEQWQNGVHVASNFKVRLDVQNRLACLVDQRELRHDLFDNHGREPAKWTSDRRGSLLFVAE